MASWIRDLLTAPLARAKNKPAKRPALQLLQLEARDVPALLALDAADVTVSATAGQDQGPEIAMRPDGQAFVVTWEAPDAGGNPGIYFQRYDANWQAVGGVTAANTFTSTIQSHASVGMDGSGNFVVTWRSQNQASGTSGFDIYARRYNASGTAIDASEFLVNTASAGVSGQDDQDPDVAVNASGQFVITWWGGAFLSEDILAKGYTGITVGGSGSPTVSFAETTVNNTAGNTDDQLFPAVAIDSAGNFVVAYRSFNQTGGTPSTYEVVARRMLANGTPASAEILVNTVTAGDQSAPDIAMDGSGNFAIVWHTGGVDGSGSAVVLQRYNAAGTAQGGNVQVNTGITTGSQSNPHVAAAPVANGDFVVTWEGEETDVDAVGTDVYYKKYTSAGGVLIGDTLINTGATAADDKTQANVGVAINSAGDFVTPIESGSGATFDILLRRFGEAPVVQFASAGSSPSEASGTSSYTVNRTGAAYVLANVATAVSVTRTGGSATPGTDFSTSFPQTVTVAAGSASQAASVALLNDTLFEGNETIDQGLAASANYTIGGTSSRTITIVDDDPAPTVSVSSPSVTEGNSGTVNLTFTISLSAASGLAVTGNYATANGTATAGSDYVANSGTFTIPAGSTSTTVLLTVNGDTLFENNETLALNLTGITNASNTTASGTGTITNDDTAPTVSVSSPSVTEGDSGIVNLTFTISLSAASGVAVTGNFATANGTATAGSDYVALASTPFTIAAGSTSTTVTVQVNGDTLFEGNETLALNLSGVTGTSNATASGTGTIADDDAAATIAIVSGNNQSAVTNAAFTNPLVVLVRNANNNPVQGVTVFFTPPTAGASFTPNPASGTTNASGQASSGTITANGTAGANYSVTAQAIGGSSPSTPFSLSNLPPVSLSINDVSVNEGNAGTTTLTFTVSLDAPAGPGGVTFDIATANGTATTADGDYVARTLTSQTIPAGQTSYTFDVTVNGDTKNEANETFAVNVTNVVGAGVSDGQGQGTITNDDAAPSLSINSVTQAEGNSGTTSYTFTITLSAASGQTVTVGYATADGTATAGTDYTAASGTLTFAPGVTTQTVTVLVTGDTVFEADQTFTLGLSNATNATISAATGTGTIQNDDAAPTLAINDVTVSESAGTATFTVTRTGATEVPIGVNYATADGTAVSTAGGPGTPDYASASGTLNFAASLAATATQTFTVPITNDAVYEATEQFTAALSGASGATIGTGTGTGTITNDDAAPTLSISSVSVAENGGPAVFTVTLTGATALPIGVSYATADGTAVAAAGGPGTPDYTSTSGTLNFAPSASATQTLTVSVPVTNDATNEPTEQFTVGLSAPTNGATIGTGTGTGTITDDDGLPSLSISDVTKAEGNSGTTAFTFTVSLSAASAQTVTVGYATADGTAVAGSDYTANSGTLTFAPGETTKTVTVLVNGDTTFENDEAFVVNLSPPTNATLADNQGVGTVTNDDAAPAVTLSLTGSPFAENGGSATATATLSNPSAFPVTVSLGFTGTASAADYTASAASITIPAGSLTGSVTLTGVNDTADENNETVVVDITGVSGGTELGTQQVTATVTDDDLPVAAADAAATNEDTPVTVASVLGSDNAAPGSTAELVGAGTPGLTLNPNGTYTYAPPANFYGTASFQYRVRNAANEVSGPATVTVTVNPVADTPSVTAATTNEDAQSTSGLVVSRNPADGPEVGFFKVTNIQNGALFLADGTTPVTGGTFITAAQGAAGLRFTPAPDSFGAGTFDLQASLNNSDTGLGGPAATATVTVNPVNDAPSFVAGTAPAVPQDSGPQAVPGFATGFVPGPANESAQAVLAYEVVGNSNPGLFAAGPAVAPNGTLVYTPAPGASGTATITVRVRDNGGTANGGTDASAAKAFVVTVTPAPAGPVTGTIVPKPARTAVALGGPAGGPAVAQLVDTRTGAVLVRAVPFGGFLGGLAVSSGDVNGDGTADLIVAAGPGGNGHVKVYDGRTGAEVRSFLSFPGFNGAVSVAAGDVNGDGFDDLLVGAGAGAPGGHVKAFSGADGSVLRSFLAYGAGFLGGVSVAAGDANGDGLADIITGSGPGAGGHVKAFDGRTGAELASFLAYPGFNGGVEVAAGDVDGDGVADLITLATGTSHVKVFGLAGVARGSVVAFPAGVTGLGVASADATGDGVADVVAVGLSGVTTQRKALAGAALAEVLALFALPGDALGPIDIG